MGVWTMDIEAFLIFRLALLYGPCTMRFNMRIGCFDFWGNCIYWLTTAPYLLFGSLPNSHTPFTDTITHALDGERARSQMANQLEFTMDFDNGRKMTYKGYV